MNQTPIKLKPVEIDIAFLDNTNGTSAGYSNTFAKKEQGTRVCEETSLLDELRKGNEVDLILSNPNSYVYMRCGFAYALFEDIYEKFGDISYLDRVNFQRRYWDWEKFKKNFRTKIKEREVERLPPDWDFAKPMNIPQIGGTYKVDQDWELTMYNVSENAAFLKIMFPLERKERRHVVGFNGIQIAHNQSIDQVIFPTGTIFTVKTVKLFKMGDERKQHLTITLNPRQEFYCQFNTYKNTRPSRIYVALEDFNNLVSSVNLVSLR